MTIDDILAPDTRPELLGQGYGFTEGPAADRLGNVYFSDGQNDSIYYWEIGKPVVRFVDDSTDAVGMMLSARGELYVCEGATHRVVALDVQTKAKRVLCGEIDGQQFNVSEVPFVRRFVRRLGGRTAFRANARPGDLFAR